jgi:transposase
MPKLLFARPARDAAEEHQVRKLARSRHAPADWRLRAQMILQSWNRLRTTAIAADLRCHPQTVRERIVRFNAEGLDGFAQRRGAGRRPRLTEAERSALVALVQTEPPGRLMRQEDGTLDADKPDLASHWTVDALVVAAHEQGIQVGRSQLRRILLAEGVRWRQVRSWATSTDPDFGPKERRSSRSTPSHQPTER